MSKKLIELKQWVNIWLMNILSKRVKKMLDNINEKRLNCTKNMMTLDKNTSEQKKRL